MPKIAGSRPIAVPGRGIALQRVGSGERLTFADGEVAVSEWLWENATDCWAVTDRPWEAEESLIRSVGLPTCLLSKRRSRQHARFGGNSIMPTIGR